MVLRNSEVVVIGGKTRIAQALVAESNNLGVRIRVVARSPEEALVLGNLYPHSSIVNSWQEPTLGIGPNQEVCIIICALGLVHPAPPDLEIDMERFRRDLSHMRDLFREAGASVHAVLVSSVVALVPPRDRAYYATHKNLAESATALLLRSLPSARLSVIYPGHLVEKRTWATVEGLLASPYSSLAKELVTIARCGKQVMRIYGIDARLWLLARILRLALTAVSRNCRGIGLRSRDGRPRVQ